MRFVVEYNPNIGVETKSFIIDEMKPTNVSCCETSYQYCVTELIDFLYDKKDCFWSDTYSEDMNYLHNLYKEDVSYVEMFR